MHQDTFYRSLIKTLSWRFIATTATALLVWLFTKDIKAALAVGGLEAIAKMILYYLHERTWSSIAWGRILSEHKTGEHLNVGIKGSINRPGTSRI